MPSHKTKTSQILNIPPIAKKVYVSKKKINKSSRKIFKKYLARYKKQNHKNACNKIHDIYKQAHEYATLSMKLLHLATDDDDHHDMKQIQSLVSRFFTSEADGRQKRADLDKEHPGEMDIGHFVALYSAKKNANYVSKKVELVSIPDGGENCKQKFWHKELIDKVRDTRELNKKKRLLDWVTDGSIFSP